MTVTNQNCIHETIKNRLISGKAGLFIKCENLENGLRRAFTALGHDSSNSNNKNESSSSL
jgi:hypothetical protein